VHAAATSLPPFKSRHCLRRTGSNMSNAPALNRADPADQLAKSAFVNGAHVIVPTKDGWGLLGQIVGPDQGYFPSPHEVFVSFPQTGFTLLVPVAALEIARPMDQGVGEPPKGST
ncbi:MAG TPA: hypothetical protein VHH34_03775, partial [Pseudonocardiaceae bacterium]|nr:hypothetical protein [Pseudonocardiaceae bacterium]